jgi:hypothetical protein
LAWQVRVWHSILIPQPLALTFVNAFEPKKLGYCRLFSCKVSTWTFGEVVRSSRFSCTLHGDGSAALKNELCTPRHPSLLCTANWCRQEVTRRGCASSISAASYMLHITVVPLFALCISSADRCAYLPQFKRCGGACVCRL